MLLAFLITLFVNRKEAQQDMEDDQCQASGQPSLRNRVAFGHGFWHHSFSAHCIYAYIVYTPNKIDMTSKHQIPQCLPDLCTSQSSNSWKAQCKLHCKHAEAYMFDVW